MKLYLDMDGVLMDYEGAIERAGVIRYREGAHWISKPRDQWPPEMIAADRSYTEAMCHPEFWKGIQPLHDAHLLWQFARPLNPHVLTATPPERPGDPRLGQIRDRIAQDKRESIWRHFDSAFPDDAINVCLRHEKAKFAGGPSPADAINVLVDDTPGNCEEWTAVGGTAILHKDAVSTIRILRELFNVG